MKIDDVLNWHREWLKGIRQGTSTGSESTHRHIVDSIEAHLAADKAKDEALRGLVDRINEAWNSYERHGAACTFEGSPMMHVSTLEELHELAAVLASGEGS